MEEKFENRIRVNGVLMGKSIGKEVSVIGNVLSTLPDGSSFDLKTSDKHVITVIPRQPVSSPLSGVVEVQGVVRTKDSLVCNYHIAFPDELGDGYDAEIANDVANLVNSIPNPWKQ